MEIAKTIGELSALRGVSGAEDDLRAYLLARLDGRADSCTVDPCGNLLVFKKGRKSPQKRLMLSAHMDEVGFIVTRIEDSGLLRFAAVGGIDSRVVVGKAVEVGDAGIYGVIGVKAAHQAEDKEKEAVLKLEDLYIDIGAETRAQAEAVVRPGDRAVFHAAFQPLGGDKLMGRALDDRAGCALLLALLEGDLPYDCHFAFTVQEEIGCIGGGTAAYTVAPDISVVVEATTASDVAGVASDRVVCKLGAGPVVSFMDKGAVYDRELYRLALDTAEKHGIPVQTKEGVWGGNESRAIQTAGTGARVLAVSLPCRYIHSPSCVIQREDIDNTYALLSALIRELGGL